MRYFVDKKEITKEEAEEIEKRNSEILEHGNIEEWADIKLVLVLKDNLKSFARDLRRKIMNKNMVKEIIIEDSERDYSNGRFYTEMIMFNEPVDFSEVSKTIDKLKAKWYNGEIEELYVEIMEALKKFGEYKTIDVEQYPYTILY